MTKHTKFFNKFGRPQITKKKKKKPQHMIVILSLKMEIGERKAVRQTPKIKAVVT